MDSRFLTCTSVMLDGVFCVTAVGGRTGSADLLEGLLLGVAGLLPAACFMADMLLKRTALCCLPDE